MLIETRGTTRVVVVLEKVVIKFPRVTRGWRTFLAGLLANLDESTTWQLNSGKYERGTSHLLCPVIWHSWGAWIVIMQKARKMTNEEFWSPTGWLDPWIEHFPGDDNSDNYGFIGEKRVKIDYGNLDYK